MARNLIAIAAFSMLFCFDRLHGDEYKFKLLKEIDLKKKLNVSSVEAKDVFYLNDGKDLFVRANADEKIKAIFCKLDKDHIDAYVWEILQNRNFLIDCPLIVDDSDKKIYFKSDQFYSLDLCDLKWIKMPNSNEISGLGYGDKRIATFQDRLIQGGVIKFPNRGFGYKIYHKSEQKYSDMKWIDWVVAFCFLKDTVLYSEILDDKVDFRVFSKSIKNDEKPELLFANEGPGCIRLTASERRVFAFTADSRLVVYDRATKKTTRTDQLFKFTISNAIPDSKSDLLLISSSDRKGDSNLMLYSCKEEKLIASIAADKFGVQAVALDAERSEIAAIGGEGVLRIYKYKK